MSLTILLTRPQREAEETAVFLRQKGLKILFLPLFAPIQKPLPPFLPLDTFQAIIATSQRAVQVFARRAPNHHTTRFYAVGDQTAACAQRLGFTDVVSAKGTVQDLLSLITQECAPEKGKILYISGAHTRHNLPALLASFDVQEEILYAMTPLVSRLPPPFLKAFEKQEIWGTLLFSPQTAFSFSSLIQQAGLGENCEIGYLFCLSHAVAAALKPLNRKIKIAKKPNQASLLEIVYETIPLY